MIKVVGDCIRSTTIKTIGEFRMKNGIRTLRQEQNIALWSKQVEECNNSGLGIAEWCRGNNIPVSTYRSRQRKVFEAFSKDSANGFVEVTVQPKNSATSPIVATISSGLLRQSATPSCPRACNHTFRGSLSSKPWNKCDQFVHFADFTKKQRFNVSVILT